MTDNTPEKIPIHALRTEPGAQELVRSEKMKPYLDLLKAQIGGEDAEPYRAALAALPLEDRYIWRVVSALKWPSVTSKRIMWLPISVPCRQKISRPLRSL